MERVEEEEENMRWSVRIQENQCTNKKRHEGGQGRMGETKVCRHQKEPGKKQHQESIPNCQRSYNAEAGQSIGHTGQKWQMCDGKGRNPCKVDRILFRTLQPQIDGNPTVLHCEEPSNSNNCPILQSEVEAAIKFLKKGKPQEPTTHQLN